MSFDPERFDDDNQARLRETVSGVKVLSADSIEDAMSKQVSGNYLCTLYDGAKSEGRLVANQADQRCRVKLSVVVVAESWRSKGAGKDGALRLLRKTKNAIVTRGNRYGAWQNPQSDSPFTFEEEAFMQRAGTRVAYQCDFVTWIHDDFKED